MEEGEGGKSEGNPVPIRQHRALLHAGFAHEVCWYRVRESR